MTTTWPWPTPNWMSVLHDHMWSEFARRDCVRSWFDANEPGDVL